MEWNNFAAVLIIILVIAAVGWAFVSSRTRRAAPRIALSAPAKPPPVSSETARSEAVKLLELAAAVYDFFQAAATPSDLVGYGPFERCVDHLKGDGFSGAALLDYYSGANVVVACAALEALWRRADQLDLSESVLDRMNAVGPWPRYFALRYLDHKCKAGEPILGSLLARLDESWENPYLLPFLKEFISKRVGEGEQARFGGDLERMTPERAQFLSVFLPRLGTERVQGLISELEAWRTRRIDLALLTAIGRVSSGTIEMDREAPIEHQDLLSAVDRLEEGLLRDTPRSFLLVGETGVGKSAIVRVLRRRLRERGWIIFQAGHAELQADMIYIGQIEARLQTVVQQLSRSRMILWVVPDFHTLSSTGRHLHSTWNALEFLVPYLESGSIIVLGETSPRAYEKLIQERPALRTALEAMLINPLPDAKTLDLAREWVRRQRMSEGADLTSDDTLNEAWNLTRQFLRDKEAPGNLLQFLALTRARLMSGAAPKAEVIHAGDLILTLSQLTGLPEIILDERRPLDLQSLRNLFESRVLGQSEAIDCLVERVAMIKAGLTDPTRPQGIFLFAGPTGTGKTEIAKTLAEYLFGSPDRMIRLDMSELQGPQMLDRLLGEPDQKGAGALVNLIRKQPFSVILLDEFEKADPMFLDLFLQVFDDGRLTDRMGNTADFRYAIIIMTSNLGGIIPGGTSLGFTQATGRFSAETVHRAIQNGFRKELLNRIDRIVVFQPLSRETMREILRNELDEVFLRRGLRNRTWALEWDESALEFLLAKGFTPDLGARPLKRAIERYLLTPLALTIVNNLFPEGDQFLFIRADGDKLTVEFVDPDAPEHEQEAVSTPAAPARAGALESPRLEDIVLNPFGTVEELEVLKSCHAEISRLVEEHGFHSAKESRLARTTEPDFWNSPARFSVLGQAEYLDRIESGLRTLGSLLERLASWKQRPKNRMPRDLVFRAAQQVYLLEHACQDVIHNRPREAFVLIEASSDGSERCDFARRLGEMYRNWGGKRGMKLDVLEESADAAELYRMLLAVTGYAAFSILSREAGLHVFEVPEDEGKSFRRQTVRVRVVPQPDQPPDPSEGLKRQAIRTLDACAMGPIVIVRRYRDKPSPLVRDSVRGWRTGRLDRVLDGDFDLIKSDG